MSPFDGAAVVLWTRGNNDRADSVEEILERLGSRVRRVHSAGEMQRTVAVEPADLIVMALQPRCTECLEWISASQQRHGAPVLVMADPDDVRLYIEAMQRGAFDGIGFPLDESELVRIGARALNEQRIHRGCCVPTV